MNFYDGPHGIFGPPVGTMRWFVFSDDPATLRVARALCDGCPVRQGMLVPPDRGRLSKGHRASDTAKERRDRRRTCVGDQEPARWSCTALMQSMCLL